MGKRFPARENLPYVGVASGRPDYSLATNGLAANGYGDHSPGRIASALDSSRKWCGSLDFSSLSSVRPIRARSGVSPIAIGLGLTPIHLISIPVTNTSVNPARSTGPAIFVGGWVLAQLWLFWIAPIVGALVAGYAYRALAPEPEFVLGGETA